MVWEGGAMMVRARDDIFKRGDLRGKKVGLTKSLNTIKNDWWRIQERPSTAPSARAHAGIELMLRMNDMTMDDVEMVEFRYPDDWYDKPARAVWYRATAAAICSASASVNVTVLVRSASVNTNAGLSSILPQPGLRSCRTALHDRYGRHHDRDFTFLHGQRLRWCGGSARTTR